MLADSRPERGELALLHALRHEAGVFEKNERRAGRARAQRREMRLDQPRAVGRHEARRASVVLRPLCRHVLKE